MDAKLTVCFDEEVIREGKAFAAEQGISLSRMLEYFLRKAVKSAGGGSYYNMPVAEWVADLAEGTTEYRTKPLTNQEIRDEAHAYKATKKKRS